MNEKNRQKIHLGQNVISFYLDKEIPLLLIFLSSTTKTRYGVGLVVLVAIETRCIGKIDDKLEIKVYRLWVE